MKVETSDLKRGVRVELFETCRANHVIMNSKIKIRTVQTLE